MSLFNGVISIGNVSTLLFVCFAVLLLGYALGRITIKGVSLGDAGVFIVALLLGALFFSVNDAGNLLFAASSTGYDFSSGLSIIESLGLVLFVTSVGYIAGPKFFGNFKRNFKSYVLLGLIIILAGGIAAAGCIYAGEFLGYGATIKEQDGFVAMIVGLLSGSLTSTPAFSAAKATVAPEFTGLVSVGHGIAYIFGVVGVVLFVQIIPKMTKANMDEERAKLVIASEGEEKKGILKLFEIDHMGIAGFSLAAILGTFIGQIKIPLSSQGLSGTCFSLTTTGGCLLASLVLGHFGRIGKVSIMPAQGTLKLFRELGLVLFLVGAGIPGGAEFVANFDPMYFVYGIVMTIVPLILGYLFAKYVLKLSLLNNLGSITGGMTSTPALGTLIGVAGTEDVAAAYAATYPIALIAVVLVSQFLVILF
ncbi:MAG: permease [Clostridia bacterium]|nr:permease [Clostridia bacterium]